MFLHLSVILFTEGSLSRGISVQGVTAKGVSVKEAPYMVMCDSTYPTGMHSCSLLLSLETQ